MPADLILSTYDKPYLTFRQQVELLQRRGMEIGDHGRAEEYLQRIGYYYLSGYMYPFRSIAIDGDSVTAGGRSHEFVSGTTFDHVLDLYVFDKRLRMLVLDAIERIELALRVDVAYRLGSQDTFAHYKSAFVLDSASKPGSGRGGRSWFEDWCSRRDRAVEMSSAQFVAHVTGKYGRPLPIWIDVELWSLGEVSHFIEKMRVQDKVSIMEHYLLPRPRLLQSWLRSICFVRNVSSHHGRLWNRNMVDYPALPKSGEIPNFDPVLVEAIPERLYISLCIIAHFMQVLCPASGWFQRVVALVDTFPDAPVIRIADMGFPTAWREHPFWST